MYIYIKNTPKHLSQVTAIFTSAEGRRRMSQWGADPDHPSPKQLTSWFPHQTMQQRGCYCLSVLMGPRKSV